MKQHITPKRVKIKSGGMWENEEWEMRFNEECSSYGFGEPCKHCGEKYQRFEKRSDGSVYNENEWLWICPRVVVAYNECGYNSTGVCLDCILEALEK